MGRLRNWCRRARPFHNRFIQLDRSLDIGHRSHGPGAVVIGHRRNQEAARPEQDRFVDAAVLPGPVSLEYPSLMWGLPGHPGRWGLGGAPQLANPPWAFVELAC